MNPADSSFSGSNLIGYRVIEPNGTDEELEKEIIEKVNILGRDGGYMISPAHIIQNDVSPERVLKFIELCRKHGNYE